MRTRLLVLFLLLITACAHQPLAVPAGGTLEVVPANPRKGFNYPYILRMPNDPAHADAGFLLVEPNNTGAVSDDIDVHLEAARKLANNAVGAYVAKKLNLPLLVPVFPRPKTEWQIYTHQLDRDTWEIKEGPMRRVDLQLIAMIEDARARLRGYGIRTEKKALFTGFSASGSFVNRFTVLHPELVQAAAMGGFNALLILPLKELDGVQLPFPLGVADVPFRAAEWKKVPQFIYMGAEDTNDAVDFDDGYSDAERTIVHTVIGKKMQPDRWEHVQSIYRSFGANAELHTYQGIGHATDRKIGDEVTEFFKRAAGR